MPTRSTTTAHTGAPVGIGWRHPHYAALLEQRPPLDFIEVHSENFFGDGGAALAVLEAGRAQYPVSLHGVGLSLGSACGLDDEHLELLARLVNRIDPVRVSDHASYARVRLARSPTSTILHAADLLPVPLTHAALDALRINVDRAQHRLRRRIAVENLSAYVRWREAEMSEPEFLCTLAQRTGCRLLVDVNNLYVNAVNDQRLCCGVAVATDVLDACIAWLDAIEPAFVDEIHIAGHCDTGTLLIDDHGSRAIAPVWDLYRHAIRRFGPLPTLIEWDTDVPDLEVLLDEALQARRQSARALQTSDAPCATAASLP